MPLIIETINNNRKVYITMKTKVEKKNSENGAESAAFEVPRQGQLRLAQWAQVAYVMRG